jgi:hypothetical protein
MLYVVENHWFDIAEEMNLGMMVIDMMIVRNDQLKLDRHKILFEWIFF